MYILFLKFNKINIINIKRNCYYYYYYYNYYYYYYYHFYYYWIRLPTTYITMQRTSIRRNNCVIRWIEIYPVHGVIHNLNNWGHKCNKIL